MRRGLLTLTGVATVLAALAGPAQAQRSSSDIRVQRGELEVVPYAGYIFTSHFANLPLGTSLGTGNGALYGAQLGLPLAPHASLVGGIAYSSADLRADAPIIGGITVGTAKAYIYEADLELRGSERTSGMTMGFTPLLQIGGGAIHRNVSFGLHATSTDFALNGGVGADFNISRGLSLRVMVKDYVGKASFNGDIETNTLNNVALNAGVRFAF